MSIKHLTLRLLLASSLVLSPSNGFAVKLPEPGSLDERVRFVDFAPTQVTAVVSAVKMSVQLEFAVDEEIVHVALGNSVAWEVAVKNNSMFLKPRELQDATNMHVMTQRGDKSTRSYQIVLAALTPQQAAKTPPFYLVKFRYPGDEATRAKVAKDAAVETSKAKAADRILTATELGGTKNYAYAVQGDTDFEPSAVYDNGKLTTFQFPDNMEIPAIYIAKPDGGEQLVPKTVQGKLVLVHATSEKFVLRRGLAVMCVFNENYMPGGIDPGTGTTSGKVERVVIANPVLKSWTSPPTIMGAKQ